MSADAKIVLPSRRGYSVLARFEPDFGQISRIRGEVHFSPMRETLGLSLFLRRASGTPFNVAARPNLFENDGAL